ncbi:response regulator transcription factor [Hominifimenecus sp. rT4P-3]|uniref:response regulator transcription factor n=1 Tax=Hominifimenecus sp. rT4P-3 TaxID=3242979 RepID=UPI003DA5AEB0
MFRILLAEDDRGIVENLTALLTQENFFVRSVSGQGEALSLLADESFDLLLLDIALSDGNGYPVCAAAKKKYHMPVIFLTASGDEMSVVTGFDMGADDYIAKPFRPLELISRIRNVLRRYGQAESTITIGDVQVDFLRGTVTKNGKELFLSALEYRLLLLFFHNKGMILSRDRLLEEIWDASGEYVNDNTLTVYIKRLRDKIEEDPQNPTILHTIRGLGYKAGDMG